MATKDSYIVSGEEQEDYPSKIGALHFWNTAERMRRAYCAPEMVRMAGWPVVGQAGFSNWPEEGIHSLKSILTGPIRAYQLPELYPQGIYEGDFRFLALPPTPFSHIEEAIEESQRLLKLPANWDDEGAIPIDPVIWMDATRFLRIYAYYLANAQFQLPAPEINPCRDGSIDLAWHTDSARLPINVRRGDDANRAYFYGDRNADKSPIKGHVLVAEFSEFLAIWMKYLV